jgi:hypothetical protein
MSKPENFCSILYRDLAPILWVLNEMYAHLPSRKGRPHADPYRDVIMYLTASTLRASNPRPSWAAIYKRIEQALRVEDEREIEMLIPTFDGEHAKVPISAGWFFRATGLKPTSISAGAIRAACRRGERTFDLVQKKAIKWSHRIPKFSLEAAKYRTPKRVVELVPQKSQKISQSDSEILLRVCQLI